MKKYNGKCEKVEKKSFSFDWHKKKELTLGIVTNSSNIPVLESALRWTDALHKSDDLESSNKTPRSPNMRVIFGVLVKNAFTDIKAAKIARDETNNFIFAIVDARPQFEMRMYY